MGLAAFKVGHGDCTTFLKRDQVGKYILVKWYSLRKGTEVGRAGDLFRTQLDCGVDFILGNRGKRGCQGHLRPLCGWL